MPPISVSCCMVRRRFPRISAGRRRFKHDVRSVLQQRIRQTAGEGGLRPHGAAGRERYAPRREGAARQRRAKIFTFAHRICQRYRLF